MSRPVALPRHEVRSFLIDGEERYLENPDGPPTGRQLLCLWHRGALALVLPDPWNQFSKAEAAWAINWTAEESEESEISE